MINPQKAIEWYKRRYSIVGESDYEIYEKLKTGHPDLDFAENPFTVQAPKPTSIPNQEEIYKKTNPGFFKKLLTANLSDVWAEDGNWWAEAYNKSIAGTIHQMMYGEAKYDVEEVDRAWYDEAGQFFVGLMSPIDVLTFFGSSGVGSIAAKTIATKPLKNYVVKGLSKMAQQVGVSRVKRKAGAEALKKAANTKFGRYLASGAAIESGFSLGTYGAAGAALQDQAQQSTEIKNGTRAPGDRDYLQTIWSATKHGTTSGILGAGAGFVTKGLMAPKFAQAKLKTNPLFANKITRLTMNPAGQVAAEGTVFGTGQIAERALMGEDVDFDDWLSSIFMNTAIVGGLRASMKPLRMGESDFTRYQKAKKEFYGGIIDPKTGNYTGGIYSDINNKKAVSKVAKQIEVAKETVKNLEEQGIPAPKELIERLATLEAEADNTVIGLDAFGRNLKDYNKLLKKMEDLPNLSPEEQVKLRAQILKDTGAINLSLYHFYSEMQTDRAFGYQVYKNYFGKKPLTDKQKNEIDLMIDQKVRDMEDVNFMINQGALNNPEAIKMAQDKYLEGFNVSAKEIKDKDGKVIGYETELKTPDGAKVSLTKAVRTKKTEAEALKFGEELKETYIKGLKGEDLEAARAVRADVEVVKYTPIKDGRPETITRPKKGEEAIGGTETIPVVKEGTKAEVDKMVQEGRAKVAEPEAVPIVAISDPTKKVEPTTLEEGMKYLVEKEKEKETIKETTLDIQAGDVVKKQQTYDEIVIDKPENKLSDSERNLRNFITKGYGETVNPSKIKGVETKKLSISSYISNFKRANRLEKLIMFDILQTTVNKNTPKTATKRLTFINNIIKYLKQKGKTLDKFEERDIIEFYDWMEKNNIALNPDNNSGIALFINVLHDKDWIKKSNWKLFNSHVKDAFSYLNVTAPDRTKPAREGVRRTAIQKGKDKSISTGDEGYELGAYVAAISGVRNEEMGNITSNLVKQDGKKRWYINIPVVDITKGATGTKISKFKTYTHNTIIPSKDMAVRLKSYLEQGGNLATGKDGKQNITLSISKSLKSDNKIAFYDLRKRIETLAQKFWISKDLKDDVKFMLGHDKTRIERFYVKDTIEAQLDAQVRIHELLKTKDIFKGEKEFRIISKGDVPAPKEVHAARKYELLKSYPEMVVDMVKAFKDKNIPEDAVAYLEKLERWTIKVKMGKAPADSIPHEVVHYAFHLIEAMGNHYKATKKAPPKQAAKTLKLYNQAKKIFVNKDGKFVNEDAALILGKAVNKQLDAPMMSKVTGWVKRFNMWLKSVFNKPLSKEEIAYALGTRIIRRKGMPSEDITGLAIGKEFRTVKDFASPSAFRNMIERNLRVASEKHGFKRKELIEFVAREAGIEKPEKFVIGLPKDELSLAHSERIEQLESFYNTFEQVVPKIREYVGKKDALQRFSLITKIEKTRAFEKGVTKAEQQRLLEAMGVEDGSIRKASIEKLKAYDEYIRQLTFVKRDNLDLITRQEINDIHMASRSPETKAFIDKALKETNMLFGTVHSALHMIGFKKFSEKLRTHYHLQEANESGLLIFNEASAKILGGNIITREARLHKIKNNMVPALDNNGEMLISLIAAKKEHGKRLPKGDAKRIIDAEAYFRKAIKPEWWNTVKDGRGDGLAKKNNDGTWKYINLETKEGKIAQEYVNNIQYTMGKDKFESALRQRTNEAEFERIVDNNGIKFLKDGIYMTRILTNEGKRLLEVIPKAKERAIEGVSYDIAIDMAKKKYGKDYTKDKIYEGKEGETIMDDARIIAEMKFDDMLYFNPGKISIKYLKDRYSLQELYIENEQGKLRRTYEMDFDKTITPYVQGMAKFYATLEMFPEAIDGMKPGNGIHKVFSTVETGAKGASLKTIDWARDVVNKQLGFEKAGEPYELVFRGLEGAARIVAKIGLSFPTAGAKNIVTGTTQTIFAQRVRDVAVGLGLVLARDAEVYNRALNSNAYSVGNVLYEGASRIDRILDATAFKAGFMRPTEKFNRLLAIAASIADQRRQFKKLGMYPKGDKNHTRSLDRLKSFYFLTDKEIAKRMKYETHGDIKMDKSLSKFEQVQMMRDIDVINGKMNTYAHVNTQGSSADLFMPKWAGKEGFRPLTLFKRMAYAATDNTQRNVREAIRNKNLMKPIMGFTATYLSGQAMLGIYSSLLGTSMPKENSDWWRRFWTTMWKGEFLGVMSEFFTPYDEGFTNTIHPAIIRTMGSMTMELGQLIEGTSNFKQFGDGLLRSTFSAYSNTRKIIERTSNPLNRDRIRVGKLYRDYLDEMGKPYPKEMERSVRSPYYEDFSKFFYLGTEEQFAKQLYLTFFAVAHDIVRQGKPIDFAFKEANSIIKGKLKTLNPNKGSLATTNKEKRMNSALFLKWLQKHPDAGDLTKRLFEIEAQYKVRLEKYMAMLPHYAKKNNVSNYYNDFDWTLRY